MREFKDLTGHSWTVRVDGGAIKRAKDLLGVDLGNPASGDPPLLAAIETDIALMVDVLYVVCRPECQSRGVTDEQFAALLEGDVLFAAHTAFMEDWADFFRRLRRSPAARAVEVQHRLVQKGMERADELMTSERMQALETQRLEAVGRSFAALLDSAESTPSPARSES